MIRFKSKGVSEYVFTSTTVSHPTQAGGTVFYTVNHNADKFPSRVEVYEDFSGVSQGTFRQWQYSDPGGGFVTGVFDRYLRKNNVEIQVGRTQGSTTNLFFKVHFDDLVDSNYTLINP